MQQTKTTGIFYSVSMFQPAHVWTYVQWLQLFGESD